MDELQILNGTGGQENLTENARNFQNLVLYEPYEKCQEKYALAQRIMCKHGINYVLLIRYQALHRFGLEG